MWKGIEQRIVKQEDVRQFECEDESEFVALRGFSEGRAERVVEGAHRISSAHGLPRGFEGR